jgi:hypothetical protein
MTIFGLNNSEVKPVLEKYIGNNRKEFKIIESELKKLIELIKSKYLPLKDKILKGEKFFIEINSSEINNSEHNKLVEKMFKDIFELRDFKLIWFTSPKSSAYVPTCPLSFLDPNYKKDEKGHKINNKLFVGIYLYTGLITYSNLNEKELMAVILHEIGHCFYNSVFNLLAFTPIKLSHTMEKLKLWETIRDFLIARGILKLIHFDEITFKIKRFLTDTFTETFPKLFSWIVSINDLFYNLNPLNKRKWGFKEFLIDLPKRNFYPFKMLFLYNVEKHSDSFATDYGYGLYLASALQKVYIEENTLRSQLYKIPILNWFLDFYDLQCEIISSCLTGYPMDNNRIRSLLDRMKRNLKDKDLSPDLRKELESQIEEFEKFYYNEYLSFSNDENKRRVFTWVFKAAVEKLFAGKADIRELIYALDPKKYE